MFVYTFLQLETASNIILAEHLNVTGSDGYILVFDGQSVILSADTLQIFDISTGFSVQIASFTVGSMLAFLLFL